MIDTHCHILPGVDDGSPDMDRSVEMATIAYEDGIRKIVATPHVYSPEFTYLSICERTALLNETLQSRDIDVAIVPGAEIVTGLHAEIIKKYSINGNGYILLEFPHSHMPVNTKDIIYNLKIDGFKPIIAHPERNPSVIRKPQVLIDIVESTDVCVQITADSLIGTFGRAIKSCAVYLMKKGIVTVIASDAHSTGFRRPVLSEGYTKVKELLGEEKANLLVFDNPDAFITGKNTKAV